jgi:hypothetical protein
MPQKLNDGSKEIIHLGKIDQGFAVNIKIVALALLLIYVTYLYNPIRSRKLRLTTVRDQLRCPRDTPLSTKVGTKFRRQVAVAQSV